MTRSLRALMDGLIGYAGLFPPAELDLDTAVREYGSHRKSVDSWMLGDFIVPVGRLPELLAYRDVQFSAETPWDLVVLPRGGGPGALGASLREDFTAMSDVCEASGGGLRVSGIEVRLPSSTALDPDATSDWLETLAAEVGPRPIDVFVEPVRGASWPELLRNAADALARLRARGREGSGDEPRYGMKLRCGGVTADAFPSIEEVAAFILESRRQRVPFKATAGLHHPLHHPHLPLGVDMHGFVNVFVGALLASEGLGVPDLHAVLGERSAGAFRWTDEGLSWNGTFLATERIADLRKDQIANYGSCSFIEPCEDLRALGWL